MNSCENINLANECINSCSQCCFKGKVLLFPDEYESIKKHLSKTSESNLKEFLSNCENFEEFYLLNQNQRCQFLNNRNLCTLHDLGLKPSECFWWPAHFYVTTGDTLEILLADYCCQSFKQINEQSEHIQNMNNFLTEEKALIIKKFRKIYDGNFKNKLQVPSE